MIISFRTKSTTRQQFQAFCTNIEPHLQIIFCNKGDDFITFYDEYGEPIFTAYETEQHAPQHYSLVQPSVRAKDLYTILTFMIEYDMATYQPIAYAHQPDFAEQVVALHDNKPNRFTNPLSTQFALHVRLAKAEYTIESLSKQIDGWKTTTEHLEEAITWLQNKYIESVD